MNKNVTERIADISSQDWDKIKLAKRRKRNSLFSEIAYRLSLLAGLGGLVGGIKLFDGINPSQQLLFSGITSVLAMLGTMIVILMLERMFKQRQIDKQTFDFDQPVESKHQLATQFEHEVSALIQQLTGKQTQVVGGAGDGGIDIKVYDERRKLIGIVQCKHFQSNKTVPPSHIRDLNTVKHFNHVNIAYLVTTGRFSKDSQKLAKQLGIRLIDGDGLKSLQKKAIPSKAV